MLAVLPNKCINLTRSSAAASREGSARRLCTGRYAPGWGSLVPYDGKKLYRYMSASLPEYEVRGTSVYKCMTAGQPVFEIRGQYIHKYMSASQPVFEIRNGRYVHEYMSASQPVYELR